MGGSRTCKDGVRRLYIPRLPITSGVLPCCFFALDCVDCRGIDEIIAGEDLSWSRGMHSGNSAIAVPSPKMPACNQR